MEICSSRVEGGGAFSKLWALGACILGSIQVEAANLINGQIESKVQGCSLTSRV